MATTDEEGMVGRAGRGLRRVLIGLAALVALVVLYYVGGVLWVQKIDDDPTFGATTIVPESGSRAVAVAADLIDREVNQHRWVANDPFFQPGYLLDNMPAYQTGMV